MKCWKNKKRCPWWYFNLRLPTGTGTICKLYGMPLEEARELCRAAEKFRNELRKSKKRKKQEESNNNQVFDFVRAKKWPGTSRGFGPVTREVL